MLAALFRLRLAALLVGALLEAAWWWTTTASSSSPIVGTRLTTATTQHKGPADLYGSSGSSDQTHFYADGNHHNSRSTDSSKSTAGSNHHVVKQYIRYNKRGTKQVMKAIHSVHRDDLTDLNDDDLFRLRNNNDGEEAQHDKDQSIGAGASRTTSAYSEALRLAKRQVLHVLGEAGITEVDDATVELLPTWDELQAMYGTVDASDPLYLGGQETCQRFRDTVLKHEAFVGTAGFFNSGTNALTYYMRSNLRLTGDDDKNDSTDVGSEAEGSTSGISKRPNGRLRPAHHHDGILTQVPWDKHYFASLKYNHTVANVVPHHYNKRHVLPIVMIRDPLTWWHSMCATPYGVQFLQASKGNNSNNSTTSKQKSNPLCKHLTIPSDNDGSPVDNVVSIPSMTGNTTWPTILHLWNDWYRAYLDDSAATAKTNEPFLMVRFEDLLFRPRAVLEAIRDCANASYIDADAFTYVVDHSKWEHVRRHGPQSTMISAMIKHGSAQRRLHGISNDDLQRARRILDPTLLRQFGYTLPKNAISNDAESRTPG